MSNLVKRAVARKPHSIIGKGGLREYAPVGSVIEVTPAQALAFPQNLIAPEVLDAEKAAAKAIKDAQEAAGKAKLVAAGLAPEDEKEKETDKEEEKPEVKTSLK